VRTLSLAILLALGFALPLRAEPLDRRQVSADAKWLAHIDFDAAKAAKVAQRIHDDWLTHDRAKETLRKIRETIGVDLLEDLRSISFYGDRFVPASGVAIIRAKVDRQRLLGYLNKEPTHKLSSHGDHQLHTWTQAKGRKDEHTVTGCFHQPNVVLLGRDADEVRAALDVLDGKSPNLPGSGSLLDVDVPAGTVFEARVAGLAEQAKRTDREIPFLSPIVRQSVLLSVALGEQEDQVFAQTQLVTKSAEAAGKIRDILEGFYAAAELQHEGDPHATRILKALKLTTSGQTVTVEWRMPGDEVLGLIKQKLTERQQPKQAD